MPRRAYAVRRPWLLRLFLESLRPCRLSFLALAHADARVRHDGRVSPLICRACRIRRWLLLILACGAGLLRLTCGSSCRGPPWLLRYLLCLIAGGNMPLAVNGV